MSGWTRQTWIQELPILAHDYAVSGKVAQVISLSASLYRETDITAHHPVLTIPFESRLEVVHEGGGSDPERWLQVRLPDQSLAWVQRGDITLNAKTLSIPESIELARRFIGVTYRWGGMSSLGYDCSGFTQMLVHRRGILMPRDADQQAAWQGVAPGARRHLKAGDLLFFGEAADKITHTGMFIGHGEFIHDTVHGRPGVQISRLKDKPWTDLLVAARRVK